MKCKNKKLKCKNKKLKCKNKKLKRENKKLKCKNKKLKGETAKSVCLDISAYLILYNVLLNYQIKTSCHLSIISQRNKKYSMSEITNWN